MMHITVNMETRFPDSAGTETESCWKLNSDDQDDYPQFVHTFESNSSC